MINLTPQQIAALEAAKTVITADIGSPLDLELFGASLDGKPYTHNGEPRLVELIATFVGNGRAERTYRLSDPAIYSWEPGSNETFV